MSSKTARLFLGVEITVAAVKALAQAAEPMRQSAYKAGHRIRWVEPAGYHVTLKYLGATPVHAIEAIRDRLAPALAAVLPFDITAVGLGAFPSPDNARVIWAGIDDPTGRLGHIAQILETELGALGFARESRPFHPHVTLGRVKQGADIRKLLHGTSGRMFSMFRARRVVLFESLMKPSGSEYIARAQFGLGSAAEGGKRQTEALQRQASDTSDGGIGTGGNWPAEPYLPLPGEPADIGEAESTVPSSKGNFAPRAYFSEGERTARAPSVLGPADEQSKE